MDITFLHLVQLFGILGTAVGIIYIAWRMGLNIVDRVGESKQKAIDYSHKKAQELEREKTELLKELDSQKQRYVQKLIDTVQEEVGKVAKKVDELSTKFVRIDERLNANAKSEQNNLKEMQSFIDATNKRFKTMEKEFTMYSGGNSKG